MIYFTSLIILFLPSYLIRFCIFGIPTTLLEILIYVAFIVTLILKLKSKNEKLQPKTKKIIIPIILFVISGIISVIIAPDKREALGLFKAYIFDPIIFFWLVIVSFKQNKNSFKILIKSLILSGTLVSIHVIWQKISGNITPDGRVLGIFGYNPNYLAFYLAPILVLVHGLEMMIIDQYQEANKVGFFASLKMVYNKIWFYDIVFILIIASIWFSGSRAGILAVIIGCGAYYVLRYWQIIVSKKISAFILFCLLTLSIIIGAKMVMPDWSLTRENGGRISSSNNVRWEIWQTTVKDILPRGNNWLLGVGLGNYQNYFTNLTKDRVNYSEWISPLAFTPHNLFLNIWVNLGLLGLVSFVWIIIIFFKATSNKATSNKEIYQSNYLVTCHLLLVTTMITILIQGLVDSPIWKNDLAVMFWLFIALGYILQKHNDQAEG